MPRTSWWRTLSPRGDTRFRFSEIIQRESVPGRTGKPVSQTKSVESATDDRAALLALLGDKLPYSDANGYKGELSLVPESLSVTEIGKEPYSYTVTDTKYIEDLENKDWALISKTTQKNGLTLPLQDVDWQTEGYNEASISYTAIAHYSGLAAGTKSTGYIATVSYLGEVEKETIGRNTYTIVYEGEQIIVPFNFVPLILAGVVAAGCIVATVLFWRMCKNVTIYTLQQGVPELYAKVRVSPKNPVLDLSRITDAGVRLVFDKRFVKSLYDQKVFVIGRFTKFGGNTMKTKTLKTTLAALLALACALGCGTTALAAEETAVMIFTISRRTPPPPPVRTLPRKKPLQRRIPHRLTPAVPCRKSLAKPRRKKRKLRPLWIPAHRPMTGLSQMTMC